MIKITVEIPCKKCSEFYTQEYDESNKMSIPDAVDDAATCARQDGWYVGVIHIWCPAHNIYKEQSE